MGEHNYTKQKGRGLSSNPTGRFEKTAYEPEIDAALGSTATTLLPDATQSILSTNQSPDLGFSASINPYRGCEHGCTYCYARPYHEYLGFSAGLDFETKILVKYQAASLLRKELSKPSWKPRTIALSGVTDAYQPLEKKLRITRQCLEVLTEFKNPVGIVTKNRLVTRDIDLLSELASHRAVAVYLSLHSLDSDLIRRMEPRSSSPEGRLDAIRELSQAGIPVGALLGPVIPGLNDHEIPAVLEAAAEAGASFASYTFLRLPHGVEGLFDQWLQEHEPGRREKILNAVRDGQGQNSNSSDFGVRMKGKGPRADQIGQLFRLYRKKVGMYEQAPKLSYKAFQDPQGRQGTLF